LNFDQESLSVLSGCIYKYGPEKYIRRTIRNTTLGFSNLSDFNDAYESEFGIAHFFHSIEDEKKLLDPVDNALTKIQKKADEYLTSVRVTCFSRNPTNNLMWAHYSDNHRGVCYAFDFASQKPPFLKEETNWGGVIYSSYIPEIKIYQDQTTEGMFPTLLNDVILTKSHDWSYEEEIRFYDISSSGSIQYKPESLKAIILGRRVSDADRKNIKKWVNEFNIKHKLDVKILFSHRITRTFSLGINSNEGFQKSSETSFSAKIPVLDNILSNPLTTLNSYK